MRDELGEMKERIRNAMDYAVPDEHRLEAEELLDIYQDDRFALSLLQEFYTNLPDALEDWVKEIELIDRRQGVFLFAVLTPAHRYMYLVSGEGMEFQGDAADGFLADEVRDYFGYENTDAFKEHLAAVAGNVYEPIHLDAEVCPVCHAISGEYHALGCVVEVCPWCGGQLVHCSCRYEQLGVDSIDSEEQLLELEALLEERGRIAYSPEQRPGFLTEFAGDEPME